MIIFYLSAIQKLQKTAQLSDERLQEASGIDTIQAKQKDEDIRSPEQETRTEEHETSSEIF